MKNILPIALSILTLCTTYAEDVRPELTSQDVLHVLKIDYAKWIVKGTPGRTAVLTIPAIAVLAEKKVKFPFGKGDKIELLFWTRREDSDNASKVIHYRFTSMEGAIDGSFKIRAVLGVDGVKTRIDSTRLMFGESTGTMDLTNGGGGGTGFLFAKDGRVVGELGLGVE